MGNDTGMVSGVFAVTGVFTRSGIVVRQIIAFLVLMPAVALSIESVRNWPWWASAICVFVALCIALYLVSMVFKKPGVYLDGIRLHGDLISKGNLFATVLDWQGFLRQRSGGKTTSTEIIPAKWDPGPAEIRVESPENVAFRFTIVDREHFQPTLPAPWHVSTAEVSQKGEDNPAMKVLIYPNKLCVVANNRATFHSLEGFEYGRGVLDQLGLIDDWLKQQGLSFEGSTTAKLVPTKTDKATAAAFGAVGMLVASVVDEKRKKKKSVRLASGELELISRDVDRELLDMLERMRWKVTI